MPRTRKPYPAEFREQMVALVRAGRSPEELSREFEPSAQSIINWVAQADRDETEKPTVRRASMPSWPTITISVSVASGLPGGCGPRGSKACSRRSS